MRTALLPRGAESSLRPRLLQLALPLLLLLATATLPGCRSLPPNLRGLKSAATAAPPDASQQQQQQPQQQPPPQTAPPNPRQSLLFGNRSQGWYAVGLLPEPLDLAADSFGSTFDAAGRPQRCDHRTILAASAGLFGLPRAAQSFTLVAVLEPPRRDNASLQGDLLTAGGLRLQWDLAANVIRLFGTWFAGAMAVISAPGSSNSSSAAWPLVVLSLSRRADGALGICVNGAPATLQTARPQGYRQLPGGWLLGSPLGEGWSLASSEQLQLGDPRATTSLNTRLRQLWLVNTAWNCTDVAAMMTYTVPPLTAGTPAMTPLPAAGAGTGAGNVSAGVAAVPPGLAAQVYVNALPVVTRLELWVWGGGTGADGEAFVGQNVTATGEVRDADGDALRVRLTWFGVPASGCRVPTCGNEGREANGTGAVVLSQSVSFKLPGRYTVRLEASDLRGTVLARDVSVLVRKLGDTARLAPCCRSTGMVIAAQTGRPVHSWRFRDPRVGGLASGALGWSADYLAAEDLEAERLFDFGVLAPLHDPVGLQLSSCLDAFLAGPGSPRVLSGSLDQRAVTTGHGKRLLVVPQGFSWGPSAAGNQTESPGCEAHWSQWAADSPYKMPAGLMTNGSRAYCSFACTPGGTRTLQQLAGMTDRLAEAMVELSYGRMSLSWDVDVTDTLMLPQTTKLDAFFYSDSPVGPFLQAAGIDRATYHSVAVLSPTPPRRINPGYTAWSSVGAATMFVMRCMPQLYYLVHEMGHLLGLPHADMWMLDNATVAPSDPAGPGLPQDAYSDKLDMMACCRGDYGALSRMWLGWMPYPERQHIPLPPSTAAPPPPSRPPPRRPAASPPSLSAAPSPRRPPPRPPPPSPFSGPPTTPFSSSTTSLPSASTASFESNSDGGDCDPSSSPTGCSYVLWPVDRSESRGRLKALSVRISDSQLVVLSYKALPWWQDMRLGRDSWDTADRDNVIHDEMRRSLTGLSAEYMRKVVGSNGAGASSFSSRGLLDFNVLFGEWPSALPPAPATLPPAPVKSAFALLREGQAWLHAGGGLLVVAQQEVECDGQSELPVYNYSVPNFYGFRGESPGSEGFRRSDYNGYAGGLRCLRVAVRTQLPAAARPGKLAVRLRVPGSDADRPLDLRGSCGFPLMPRLQLQLLTPPQDSDSDADPDSSPGQGNSGRGNGSAAASPPPANAASAAAAAATADDDGVGLPPGIAAVVWKDPRNVTFASGTLAATLPPFSDGWVREASAADSPACVYGCDPLYRVRIASYDGAQTLATVRVVQVSLRYMLLYVSYRYYQLDRITTESEVLYVPVVAPWLGPAVPYGSPVAGNGGEAGNAAPPPPPPAASDPRDTAWGMQLLGDAAGSRRLAEQPAVTWTPEQLPYTACSRQFSLTLLVKLRYPAIKSGRWPLAAIQLDPAAAGGSSGGGGAYEGPKLWVVWDASATTAANFPTASTDGNATSTAAPLTLAVTLDPNRQTSVTMALPPLQIESPLVRPMGRAIVQGERIYHVALVYDKGRVGVWVDGGGGWPWRDAACVPPRADVTYCRAPGGGPSPGDMPGEVPGPLGGVSLLGGTPGLDASLLSARLYNYALPRADLADESTCLLAPRQDCAARFGLRAAAPSVSAPSPAAVATAALKPASAALSPARVPAGTLAFPVAAAQRSEWDLLAASAAAGAAAAATLPPGPTPRTRYRLQVGNWSACSAACGGGVTLRSVRCLRAANKGPWAVGLDDCPLAALPPAAAVCNLQPCPARWPALTPVPGPSQCSQPVGCAAAAAAAAASASAAAAAAATAGGAAATAATRQLQPTCLQAGGVQLRLGACVTTAAAAAATVVALGASAAASKEAAATAAAAVSATAASGVPEVWGGGTWQGLTLQLNISLPVVPIPPDLPRSARDGGGALQPPLPPQPPPSRSLSLRQAVLQGALQQACDAAAADAASLAAAPAPPPPPSVDCGASDVAWRFGPWGPCHADCSSSGSSDGGGGGGARVRAAACVNTSTGESLEAALCAEALGPLPPALLRAPCGGRPCGVAALQLGPWSACDTRRSVLGNGRATRTASCVVARAGTQAQCGGGDDGGDAARWSLALSSDCRARPAPFSALCMVPSLARKEADCFGNGACSYAGCICKPGYSGQMCEVFQGTQAVYLSMAQPSPRPPLLLSSPRAPPAAPPAANAGASSPATAAASLLLSALPVPSGGACPSGILDRQGACCHSGHMATDGTCCADAGGAAGSGSSGAGVAPSLDGLGRCCYEPVDACGVCGGSGVAVDVQGACCATLLDQYGVCCASGLTDECGVCDGDGTTCAVRLQLRLTLTLTQSGPISNWVAPALAPATSTTPSASLATAGVATALPGAASAAAAGAAAATPAAATLGQLLRLALGPVQGGTLSIALAAATAVDAVAADAAVEGQPLPPPPQQQQQGSIVVTFDITYGDSEAGGEPTVAASADATATAASTVAGSADVDARGGSPLGPYNFTTAAVGLRLEALRDLLLGLRLQGLSQGGESDSVIGAGTTAVKTVADAAAADSQAGKLSGGDGDAAAVGGRVTGPQEGVPEADAGEGEDTGSAAGWDGDGGGAPQLSAVDAALAASGTFLLRQQEQQPQRQQPHAEVMQQLAWSGQQRGGLEAAAEGALADRYHRSRRRRRRVLSASVGAGGGAPPPSPPSPSLPQAPSPPAPPAPSPPAPASAAAQSWTGAQALLIGGSSEEVRGAAAALGLLGLEVYGIERLGVCGNGVCEVGEQLWPGSTTEAVTAEVAAAAGGCPADCPLALRACPAGSASGGGSGSGGGDVRQCSGRGVCLMASGACTCFEGYTGDACELCAPGFQRAEYGDAAGVCVRQYIRGRTVLEWDEMVESSRSEGLLDNFILFACLVAGSTVLLALTALSAFAWVRRRKLTTVGDTAVSDRDRADKEGVAPDSTTPPSSVTSGGAATPPGRRRSRRSPRATPRRAVRAGRSLSHGAGAEADEDGPATPLVAGGRPRALVHVYATGDDDREDWLVPLGNGGEGPQAAPAMAETRKSRSRSAPANCFDVAGVAAAQAAAVPKSRRPEGAVPWGTDDNDDDDGGNEGHQPEDEAPVTTPRRALPPRVNTNPASSRSRERERPGGPRQQQQRQWQQDGEDSGNDDTQRELSGQRRPQAQDPGRQQQQQQQHETPPLSQQQRRQGRRRAPLGEAVEARRCAQGLGGVLPGSRPGPGALAPIGSEGGGAAGRPTGHAGSWSAFMRQLLHPVWPGASGAVGSADTGVSVPAGALLGAAGGVGVESVGVTQRPGSAGRLPQGQLLALPPMPEDEAPVERGVGVGSRHTALVAAARPAMEMENGGDHAGGGRSPPRTPSPPRRTGTEHAALLEGAEGGSAAGECSAAPPLWDAAAAAPAVLMSSSGTPTLWRTPRPPLEQVGSETAAVELGVAGTAAAAAAVSLELHTTPEAASGAAAAAAAAAAPSDLTPRNLAPAMFAAAQPRRQHPAAARSPHLTPSAAAAAPSSSSSSWRWWSPASAGSSGGAAAAADAGDAGADHVAEDDRAATLVTPLLSPAYEATSPAPMVTLTVATRRNRTGSTGSSYGYALASPHAGGSGSPAPSTMTASPFAVVPPHIAALRNLEPGFGTSSGLGDASVVKSPRRSLLQSRGHSTKHD